MIKELIIASSQLETKIALLEDGQVNEVFIERRKNKGILGNLYKGRVTKVLPGMQAAFVDIGLDRNAFLYVDDFVQDYEEYEELFVPTGEDQSPKTWEAGPGPEESVAEAKRQRPQTNGNGRDQKPSPESRDREGLRNTSILELMPQLEVFLENEHVLPSSLSSLETGGIRESESVRQREGKDTSGPLILPEHFEVDLGALSGQRNAEVQGSVQVPPPSPRIKRPESPSRRRKPANSRPGERVGIGDLLSEGQEILVQIAKESIGRKGARITSHVAFPGRFVVYMPTVEHIGVSHRIAADEERQRLRKIVLELRRKVGRGGFIVRTAGGGQSENEFQNDMQYLTQLWDDIRLRAEKLSAPSMVYAEPGLVQRIVRDFFSQDFKTLYVDNAQVHKQILQMVKQFSPNLARKVRLYRKSKNIFDDYGISAEIEQALRPKVWLKKGGSIEINQTEALVAIDVNTGKYVGSTNSLEDTITKTNLDAVKELVRQIRLRDLGGIIVIDFIDMANPKNRQKVLEELQAEMKKDKAPSKILGFNEFGLIAVTRKRVKQSLERVLLQKCTFCGGRGMTRSVPTICHTIHEEAEKMSAGFGKGDELIIRCHPDVGKALRNGERDILTQIGAITGKQVKVKTNPLMHIERFELAEA
mgnify:CR=1 FL=1